MKHLFWIITGVVIVGLLIAWTLSVPIAEARASKEGLDTAMRELDGLEKRAANGSPAGLWDLESADQSKELASKYLITENWQRVLQPHIVKYQKQLADTSAHLVKRGAWLSRPVATTTDRLEWYNAYIAASEALIDRLRESGCLRPAQASEARSSTGESPDSVRQLLGLYTKAVDFPEPGMHAQLTMRLRAVELIAERLIAARIAIAENPVVGRTGRREDRARAGAMFAGVEWGGGRGVGQQAEVATAISGDVRVRALPVTLTLEGAPSALVAGIAGLEANREADRPLALVSRFQLARRGEATAAGERFDAASDSARLVIGLGIIDFAAAGGN